MFKLFWMKPSTHFETQFNNPNKLNKYNNIQILVIDANQTWGTNNETKISVNTVIYILKHFYFLKIVWKYKNKYI